MPAPTCRRVTESMTGHPCTIWPALARQPHELKAGADCSGANLEGVNLVELVEAGVISWFLNEINLE